MNFMSIHRVAQALRLVPVVFLSVVLASCGGRGVATSVAPPTDPEMAVRSFMNAVSANSLLGMSQLFGSSRGPASDHMDQTELEQRLTVIRIYLEHEEFSIVPGDPVTAGEVQPGERVVFIRLTRKGCTPTVPFTLSPYQGGWLIRQIDLAAAGNPARRCGGGPV